MAMRRSIPVRAVLRRPTLSSADILVGALLLAILYIGVHLGRSLTVNFTPGHSTERISTNLSNLPYYALRSLTRMFIALGLSTLFTFVSAPRPRDSSVPKRSWSRFSTSSSPYPSSSSSLSRSPFS